METYYHENCEGEVTGINSDTEIPTCLRCGQSGEAQVESRLDGTRFVFFRTQKEIEAMHKIDLALDDWHKQGVF
jgi:hypothetical protein